MKTVGSASRHRERRLIARREEAVKSQELKRRDGSSDYTTSENFDCIITSAAHPEARKAADIIDLIPIESDDGDDDDGADRRASKQRPSSTTRCRSGLPRFVMPLLVTVLLFCNLCRTISAQQEDGSTTAAPTPVPLAEATIVPTFGPAANGGTAPPAVFLPTVGPTIAATVAPSLRPTPNPTNFPTVTSRPTVSAQPSNSPSIAPSKAPSVQPTPALVISARKSFQQILVRPPSSTFFTDNETAAIMSLYANYTYNFANGSAPRVRTTFTYRPPQTIAPDGNSTRLQNTVDFSATYESNTVNVTSFPDQFLVYTRNLTMLTQDLKALGLSITAALPIQVAIVQTEAPTVSPAPTSPPSQQPTLTTPPTVMASNAPSARPTSPTAKPTKNVVDPVTDAPTPAPNVVGSSVPVAAIASITVLGGVAVLIGLVVYYKRRVKRRQSHRRGEGRTNKQGVRSGGGGIGDDDDDDVDAAMMMAGPTTSGDSDVGVGVLSPSSSNMSGKSLVSEGDSGLGGESGDEMDNTKNLQTEFDEYKGKNLEQLQSEVQGNLEGYDGMMSATVTRALMGEDIQMDNFELLWGCTQDPPAGAEIEASALCDVCDWLKRNENASTSRKASFMQDLLNRMVASVQHNKIQAHDASRTIHESAALLGLQLANDLPMTTTIISGMRKTVAANEIVEVLDEFGDIDTAAVASGGRGFGIVRFRHPKSVDRAMRKYRTGEIVVEDVAVQLRVLMPSGEVVSRN